MLDDMFDFLPEFNQGDIFNPWDSNDSFVGNPQGDTTWAQQTTDFSCAVVSQQMILRDFGLDLSEAQLVYDSVSNGWLNDEGTTMEDVGSLLNHYGIPTHQGFGNGIDSLLSELAQGHKVIVGVDSGELWGTDFPFSDWIDGGNGADHAIVVNGIDTSDPSDIKVYVNDSGDPNGAGRPYALDDFMGAWSDSGKYYVSTSVAPEGLGDHAVFGANFNDGWYFDPDSWVKIGETIISSVGKGVATSTAAFELTGSGEFSSIAGGVHAAWDAYHSVKDLISEDELNDYLRMI